MTAWGIARGSARGREGTYPGMASWGIARGRARGRGGAYPGMT